MSFGQKIQFYLQNLDTKKRVGLVAVIFLLIVLPVVLLLSSQRQETRQHASGEQTELYFADVSGARLSTLSLQPGQQSTIALYLDTKGNPVNGFDTTIYVGNLTQFANVTNVATGTDANKFNVMLAEVYDPTAKTIHYARVTNTTGTIIQGVLQLGTATITANVNGTGTFAITKATITSAGAEGAGNLTVGLPTLTYAINIPTLAATSPTVTPPTATPTTSQAQTYPGIDLTTIEKYKNGPCASKTENTCIFDTRWVGNLNGQTVESITAYGKGWNYTINGSTSTPWPNNGFDLNTIPRYANGPCQGHSPCTFESRTILVNGTESITAYGKGYNFDNNGQPWPNNGFDLTTIDRFKNGPCASQAANTCKLDTHWDGTLGNSEVESITAYGKGYNFNVNGSTITPWPGNGFDLTSIPRFAKGPCQGKATGTCTFDTRTITPDGTESETAYGKEWNFRGDTYISTPN